MMIKPDPIISSAPGNRSSIGASPKSIQPNAKAFKIPKKLNGANTAAGADLYATIKKTTPKPPHMDIVTKIIKWL